jgi:hypothetical protein
MGPVKVVNNWFCHRCRKTTDHAKQFAWLPAEDYPGMEKLKRYHVCKKCGRVKEER